VVTKADGSVAPSFATAVLRQQLDSLYGLGSALMSTLAAIVSSAASDTAKGPLVQDALEAFTTAVRQAFAEAGIAVPVEKRDARLIPTALEVEILKTARTLAPTDPLGAGMRHLTGALQLVQREWRPGRLA
jgi:hypothetical protein